MRDTHLRNIDLNLLRAIQPLLEERHISRAAKRAFLSQPAMSRALNRLRATFGDPLLVRSDGIYERTPRGERVLRETEAILRRLNVLVNDQEFIPAQSRERFRIAIPAVLAIAQTDLVLTVPRTLANVAKQISTLRTIEPPRELKSFPYFMSWHPRLTNEPAQVWLRDQVRIAARSVRENSRYGQKGSLPNNLALQDRGL
jgi:DNA-binding transcriptional LysR family regulator